MDNENNSLPVLDCGIAADRRLAVTLFMNRNRCLVTV